MVRGRSQGYAVVLRLVAAGRTLLRQDDVVHHAHRAMARSP